MQPERLAAVPPLLDAPQPSFVDGGVHGAARSHSAHAVPLGQRGRRRRPFRSRLASGLRSALSQGVADVGRLSWDYLAFGVWSSSAQHRWQLSSECHSSRQRRWPLLVHQWLSSCEQRLSLLLPPPPTPLMVMVLLILLMLTLMGQLMLLMLEHGQSEHLNRWIGPKPWQLGRLPSEEHPNRCGPGPKLRLCSP